VRSFRAPALALHDLAAAAGEDWDAGMDVELRFAALVDALAGRPGVVPPGEDGGRGFGSSAMKVDGAIFAMPWRDALVLKLPGPRVAELIGAGIGTPFDAGKGRPMREWVALPNGSLADDLALAEEALVFVRSRAR
jgi:hypothetical protein